MSLMDPVKETEAEVSPELSLESRKEDFCRDTESIRSNITPVFDDKLKISLQPAKIC